MTEIAHRLEIIKTLVEEMEETENNFDLLEVYIENLLYKVQAYREDIGE